MALSVEKLAEIKLQLEARATLLEMDAACLREDAACKTLEPEIAGMRLKAAQMQDIQAAQVRGLIACIEEELGREKADT